MEERSQARSDGYYELCSHKASEIRYNFFRSHVLFSGLMVTINVMIFGIIKKKKITYAQNTQLQKPLKILMVWSQ